MRQNFAAVLTAVVLGLCLMAGFPAPAQAIWTIDADLKFKIDVPAGWQRNAFTDEQDKVHAFISPDEYAAVRVRAFKCKPGLTPDILGDAFESRILPLRFQDIRRVVRHPADLNQIEGAVSSLRAVFDGFPVTITAFYTVQNGVAYIVWYAGPTARQDYVRSLAEPVVSTFAILP